MTSFNSLRDECSELEYAIASALVSITTRELLKGMGSYKWKPWERRKLEDKIDRLTVELRIKRLQLLEYWLSSCRESNARIKC